MSIEKSISIYDNVHAFVTFGILKQRHFVNAINLCKICEIFFLLKKACYTVLSI